MCAPLPPEDLAHVMTHTRDMWEDVRGQRVFMTGGTGFVGTWLLESLLWANDHLALQARVAVLTRDPQRFRREAPHLALHPMVDLVAGDLLRFDFPDGPYPFVVHAATESSAQPDAAHVLKAFTRDVDGTRRLLDLACGHGVRRFLFTSSGAVYGAQPPAMTHVAEDYAGAPSTLDAGSGYAQTKRVLEAMVAMYGRANAFDPVIARLFAFVGPRLPLDAHYAVGNFIGDALRGGPIRIAWDGTPFRSYLYAADLAIWLWTMLFRGQAALPYNVGSPDALSIRDLAQTVASVVAPEASIETARKATAGLPPLRYVPCTQRAETTLGLRPLVSLEDGIRRTASWHRAGTACEVTR